MNPGDVLLGNRAFCAYADLIKIKNLACDAVFRKHESRKTEMRRGKIVVDCDKLVVWNKPNKCPKGLTEKEFNSLPTTLIGGIFTRINIFHFYSPILHTSIFLKALQLVTSGLSSRHSSLITVP